MSWKIKASQSLSVFFSRFRQVLKALKRLGPVVRNLPFQVFYPLGCFIHLRFQGRCYFLSFSFLLLKIANLLSPGGKLPVWIRSQPTPFFQLAV